MASLGEDGDLIALGHHDSRRVVAAFNRHARHHSCWLNMADETDAAFFDEVGALHMTYVVADGIVCGSCVGGRCTCRPSRDRFRDGWDPRFEVNRPGPGVVPVTAWQATARL